jgi:TetR/AcrR family transcriptional repressor of nem operon
MVRPRQFDRRKALHDAMRVFWAKGFAGTSTDDLLRAMGIGRQSLYNTFGDKRRLYLEALATYLNRVTAAHLARLNAPKSPLAGIRDLLAGVTPDEDRDRSLGCMGVSSVSEFGTTDAEIASLTNGASLLVLGRLAERIGEGQSSGEIDPTIDPAKTAGFVQVVLNGLQISARGGTGPSELATFASFTVERLRNN